MATSIFPLSLHLILKSLHVKREVTNTPDEAYSSQRRGCLFGGALRRLYSGDYDKRLGRHTWENGAGVKSLSESGIIDRVSGQAIHARVNLLLEDIPQRQHTATKSVSPESRSRECLMFDF